MVDYNDPFDALPEFTGFMRHRMDLGKARYGDQWREKTLHQIAVDAIEEVADLAVYSLFLYCRIKRLMSEIERGGGHGEQGA